MFKSLIPLFLSLFFLCSWVDPQTVDTYSGSISFNSSSYDVTPLFGSIEYFLMSYQNFGLSDSGSLINASPSTVKGSAIIGGVEYPIQFLSNDGLQIQQQYYSNNILRSTWVSYDLYPDVVPSPFDLSDLSSIFILFVLFIIIPLFMIRGIE